MWRREGAITSISGTHERTELYYGVSRGVLIPSLSVLFVSSCLCCFLNSLLHFLLRPGALKRVLRKFLNPDGIPLELAPSLNSWAVNAMVYDSAFDAPQRSGAEALHTPSPYTQGTRQALQGSLQHVRLEAQQLVFQCNPKYMFVATAKSLTMLVVVQYHYDYPGGWERLAVCCAANLMSGLLTPVLEHAAGLLLPIDTRRNGRALGAELDEEKDSALIVEILLRVGQLELEDIETVLIQGAKFIIFGVVFLPAVLVFCLPGFAAFLWAFIPPWFVYAVLRYLYYRESDLPSLPLPTSRRWGMSLLYSPLGEFAAAIFMKIITLFLLQWTVQSSFLLGFALLDGWTYGDALRLEAQYQLCGWCNPREMTKFYWLCFVSQLFF